jgi:hypothetical protein
MLPLLSVRTAAPGDSWGSWFNPFRTGRTGGRRDFRNWAEIAGLSVESTPAQIRLSDTLDHSIIDASYENGVLTITVPMREESKPRTVSIQSKRETIEAGMSS